MIFLKEKQMVIVGYFEERINKIEEMNLKVSMREFISSSQSSGSFLVGIEDHMTGISNEIIPLPL